MLSTNTCLYSSVIIRRSVGDEIYVVYKYLSVQLCNNQTHSVGDEIYVVYKYLSVQLCNNQTQCRR